MSRFLNRLTLFLLLVASALGAELKVGTLNCYLFFDPGVEHRGKLDDASRMAPGEYLTKVENLATLLQGYQVIAVQETGGRAEIAALAKAAGCEWAWTEGRDTATGQEVGLLHHLPGWTVVSKGRIADLDKVVSKHLLVQATKEKIKVYILAVHLLRPIGTQADRAAKQRAAIGAWMKGQRVIEPNAVVVVAGDTNFGDRASVYGLGKDAGELNQYAPTHLAAKPFDRLVTLGGSWKATEIRRPPYGPRPNDLNKRLWSDHYFVGATLETH